jgi:hypothetical protein
MPDLLGEVISWDLGSAECSYQEVVDSLTEAGLDPAAAREMKPRTAFTRACKHLKEQRTIDKLKVEKGQATFQFTGKELKDDRLAFDYQCLVKLNTETGEVSCPENSTLETQARELIAHAMQTRNSSDVTRIVQKMFLEHADLYAIHRRGYAHFVPECHRSFTEKVEKFVTKLGGKLVRFPVPKGTPEGNASVKEAVQKGLSDLLTELTDTVSAWDDSTRQDTMDRAIKRWEAISYKVSAYSEYLESEQDRLQEALAKAKEGLAKRIGELKPEDVPQA